jgi:cold shock CspA family protein
MHALKSHVKQSNAAGNDGPPIRPLKAAAAARGIAYTTLRDQHFKGNLPMTNAVSRRQFDPALSVRCPRSLDLQRLFGKFAHLGEMFVRYARPNGDLTAPLPSSHHMTYVAKGWTAVSIDEPTPAEKAPAIVIPGEILGHGRHDRVGIWTRGNETQRQTGVVLRFYDDRGFGFIETPDGSPDTFDVQGREALLPGMRVSFIPSVTEKGPRARAVIIQDEGARPNQATQVEAV